LESQEKPKPKANPFGDASAVDTASKLAELEIKESASKESVPVKQEEATPEEISLVLEEAKEMEEEPKEFKQAEETMESNEKTKEEKEKREKKRREPEVINSRAAAFESSAPIKREVSMLHCFNTLLCTRQKRPKTPCQSLTYI
jgi:hypothetical protein